MLGTSLGSSAGPVIDEAGPNLVTNGGFENTSSMAGSGWAVSGAYLLEGFDYFVDLDPANAQSGTHSFAGGAIGGLGYISQTLATAVGENYNIHLWLANFSGFSENTATEVRWGGNVVYSATDIPGFAYSEILVDPIATSASTVLSIGLQDDALFLNVDDISVRQLAEQVPQVPEPATLALLGLGLAGLGFARRKQ